MEIQRTAHGWLILRPTSTIAIEKLMYGRAGYRFAHADRTIDNRADYDTRYVGQYRLPYVWIAGWWDSYYGTYPHTTPAPLLKDYPFHHPWVVAADYDDHADTMQRKSLLSGVANSAWWAVEVSSQPEPTMSIPDLSLHVPSRVLEARHANPTVLPAPTAGDLPVWDQLSPAGRTLVRLPIDQLVALSNRITHEGAQVWAWHAALWGVAAYDLLPTANWTELAEMYKLYHQLLHRPIPRTLATLRPFSAPVLRAPSL